MVAAAEAEGLPLARSDERSAIEGADLVVAMGQDATMDALRTTLPPSTRFLGFGHRFSVAWVRSEDGLAAVARDAALHDGFGCMSPVGVFTSVARSRALAVLGKAMARAEAQWPRGPLAAADAAALRAERATAKVVGKVVEGPGWAVHALPLERFRPVARPRVLSLHEVPDAATWKAALGPWLHQLSTVGTDDPDSIAEFSRTRGPRMPPGEMQRPPLLRLHDGVDWVRETLHAP